MLKFDAIIHQLSRNPTISGLLNSNPKIWGLFHFYVNFIFYLTSSIWYVVVTHFFVFFFVYVDCFWVHSFINSNKITSSWRALRIPVADQIYFSPLLMRICFNQINFFNMLYCLIHVFWLNMSFFVIDFLMSGEEVWASSYCPSTLNAKFHKMICSSFFMNYLWICCIDFCCCWIVHSMIFHITVLKI